MREIFHVLNIADWALIAAGLAVAFLMMLVNADDQGSARKDARDRRQGRTFR